MTEKHMLCQLSHTCHAARQQRTLAPVCWINSPPFFLLLTAGLPPACALPPQRSACRQGKGQGCGRAGA